MRLLTLLALLILVVPAFAQESTRLPKVAFSAISVQEVGALRIRQRIHYEDGRLRIEGNHGFATTILDLNTGTECLLMANRTFLVLPLDNELFRRFFAPSEAASGERLGRQPISGIQTTKYHFEGDGALDAGGFYWLSDTGIMLRRVYDDGVFGVEHRHLDYLSDVEIKPQDQSIFRIPAGYRAAR